MTDAARATAVAAGRARMVEELGARILATVAAVPEEALHREAEDGWSAAHVLAHVAEFVRYWASQAETVAARERQDLPFGRTHDDPERIAAIEERWREGGERLASGLRSALDQCVATLRGIPEERWRRAGVHRRGRMTVAELVDRFLVEHLAEHETQLRRALGGPDRE